MQPAAAAAGGGSVGGMTGTEPQLRQEAGGLVPATAALVGSSGGWEGLECRRFEVAGVGVEIRQDLRGSNALRPLDDDRVWADSDACGSGGGGEGEAGAPPILTAEDLSRVGLVAWQAGFVLADLLLRRPPFGSWHGAQVLDLGCGTGLVGILLALVGAEVTLTDQPHIVPLAEANARANLTPGLHWARIVPHTWGQGDAAAALLPPPALPAPAAADALPEDCGVWRSAGAAVHRAAEAGGAAGGAAGSAGGRAGLAAGLAAAPAAPQLAEAAAASGEGQSPAGRGAGAARGILHLGGAPAAAQHQSAAAVQLPPAPSFDVITAADVVYEPERYAELAGTLRALAAPHTLVYLAFKRRGLKEDTCLELLEGAGFAVREVPQGQLAEEYRGSAYRVVRACRIE